MAQQSTGDDVVAAAQRLLTAVVDGRFDHALTLMQPTIRFFRMGAVAVDITLVERPMAEPGDVPRETFVALLRDGLSTETPRGRLRLRIDEVRALDATTALARGAILRLAGSGGFGSPLALVLELVGEKLAAVTVYHGDAAATAGVA